MTPPLETPLMEKPGKRRDILRWRENRLRRLSSTHWRDRTERQQLRLTQLEQVIYATP